MWKNFQTGLALEFVGAKANYGTKGWQAQMNEGEEGRKQDEPRLTNGTVTWCSKERFEFGNKLGSR